MQTFVAFISKISCAYHFSLLKFPCRCGLFFSVLLLFYLVTPLLGSIEDDSWISSSSDFGTGSRFDEDDSLDSQKQLFQGDIIGVDINNIEQVIKSLANYEAPKFRHAMITHSSRLWPNKRIPYTVSDSYDSRQKRVIEEAIGIFHEKSCVQFVQRTTERDYVDIRAISGCFSALGRVGGAQPLSLDHRCVRSVGVVIHELMHALGFLHEHTRPDRDQFVKILWENIQPTHWQDFSILPGTQTLDLPYDYNSIMHYGQREFSRNGDATVVPVQSSSVRIGRISNGFTAFDLQKLNKYYHCSTSDIGSGLRPDKSANHREDGEATSIGLAEETCVDRREDCRKLSVHKPKDDQIGPTPTQPQVTTTDPNCVDQNQFCRPWADSGFCKGLYSAYMELFCRQSCDLCQIIVL